MTEEDVTTIQVKKSTRDLINDNRKGSQTQDEFVKVCVDKWVEDQKEES